MDEVLVKAGRLIAQIAARQHGVITTAQLAYAGLTPTMITDRVRRGFLHRLYRGVYAVGHKNLTQEGRWLAAVLAFGPKALLSHASAAALWSLVPWPTSAVVHVTVPAAGTRRKRCGIQLHYSSTLTSKDLTRRHNIPVTTRERTLADMGWGAEPTRSHLERLFVRLVSVAGLPKPEVNVHVGPYRVDFLWRAERVVVEVDGFAFHSSRGSFESDRARDRELQRRGYVVLRFTYREVNEEPDAVAASLWSPLRDRNPRRI
ncbi:MAG: DUF559 domain-containing protein [Solirubrobacterales bacterium]